MLLYNTPGTLRVLGLLGKAVANTVLGLAMMDEAIVVVGTGKHTSCDASLSSMLGTGTRG